MFFSTTDLSRASGAGVLRDPAPSANQLSQHRRIKGSLSPVSALFPQLLRWTLTDDDHLERNQAMQSLTNEALSACPPLRGTFSQEASRVDDSQSSVEGNALNQPLTFPQVFQA